MAIINYNALIINTDLGLPGAVTNIGVLRGVTSPLIIGESAYAKYAFEFSNSADGTAISNGLFDGSMGFFGNNNTKNSVDGSLFKAFNSNGISIIFPGGCSVVLTWYNDGYYLSYNSKKDSIRTGAWPRNTMCGLMSDDIYEYEVMSNNTPITRMALMQPYIFPFTKTVDGEIKYFARLCNITSIKEYYPINETYIDETSSESNRASFQQRVDVMRDFWRDVDSHNGSSYWVMPICGPDGTITPRDDWWASANEPRMFTVTPDEHHAIHSVTAYNATTNAQIPLQESAMDLLTGAKSYMFTMPAANVRIIVEFRSIEITIPVTVSYTSPRGRVYTTSFNLLYDDSREEQEGET